MGRPKVDPNDRFGQKIADRFFSHTERTETGCLEWKLSLDRDGYGRFSVGGREGKKEYAHNWAYDYANRDKPKREPGILVCHHCDNPTCVDEKHLFSGTQQENMDDMVSKNRRGEVGRGTCKFDDDQVRALRSSTLSNKELALQNETTALTIRSLRAGKTYKHVK